MPEHQQIQQSKKPDTIFQKQATPISQTPASNPYSIIQRAKINPKSLTHADIMQLQRTIGNQAVGRLLSSIGNTSTAQQATVQRQEIPEEDKTCPSCMQRQEIPEEEEPLQGKMIQAIQRQEIPEEEEPLQGKMIETIQRQEIPEEEEPLQGKMIETIQRQEIPEEEEPLQTKKENNTGMPDNLKAGVESLSGIDISDVKVHYNSDKPAEVGALAYTQGTNIHVAPGQEKHLPHEAWHVVQQAQGRVRPTIQLKDEVPVNDDEGLEREADNVNKLLDLGKQRVSLEQDVNTQNNISLENQLANSQTKVVQRKVIIEKGEHNGTYDSQNSGKLESGLKTTFVKWGNPERKRGIEIFINSNDNYRFNTISELIQYITEDEENTGLYTKELQLQPEDMIETGKPPDKYTESKGCVVQAIAQVKGNKPEDWHKYFISRKIDYTESMNHIKVFSSVGLELIHNVNQSWGEIDPILKNGKKYIFINMNSPGQPGHAFAATKNKSSDYTVHDIPQNRIKKYEKELRIQYVFA